MLAMHRLIALLAAGFLHTACAGGDSDSAHSPAAGEADVANTEEIAQIISTHGDLVMSLEDVVGIGEGLCDGNPCIRVFLARDNAVSLARISEYLAGIPYSTEITGEFTARPQ